MWTDITKLTELESQKREVAFENEMLASLTREESKEPIVAPTQSIPVRDGIHISVTDNGRTTHFSNLETVPLPVRQKILRVWGTCSAVLEKPPVVTGPQPPPPLPRRNPLRFAMALNLILPGAGQFYMRQPLIGAVYALGFLGCFVTMLLKFMDAYFKYMELSTSGDVLGGDNLEQLSHAFPSGILTGLTIISILIFLASSIHLVISHRRKSAAP